MRSQTNRIKALVAISIILLGLLAACRDDKPAEIAHLPPPIHFDLDSIKKRGKIILLTENSASTYYLYRDQTKGFDFELVKAFAKHIGVKLEVRLLHDADKMFELLNLGDGDIIASNITITPERKKVVGFTKPVYETRQVLVQRKFNPLYPDSLLPNIKDTNELGQLPIWVHRYSSFYSQLKKMEKRMNKSLKIEEAPGNISTDDLIRLTASGEIESTVTDENLALIQQSDYPELDMSLAISSTEPIAWAVRSNAGELLEAIDAWMQEESVKKKIARTYSKYFVNSNSFDYRGPYILPELSADKISVYDSLFKKYAPEIGWDWRLLASLVYQESRFNPHAESWSGAFGLMQLMPETAIKFGCDSGQTEEPNIRAGTRYLKYLDRFWQERVPNKEERLKFVLASYNIGPGHILDARNIAVSMGKPDTIWDGSVAECLLLKTQEKYYTMDVVKHGYCRAQEPFHFVGKILAVFEHYKSIGKN